MRSRPTKFVWRIARGGIGLVWLSAIWVLSRLSESWDDVDLHSRAIFYYCILAILLGAQLLVAGLLAELIVSVTRESREPYSISERTAEEQAAEEQAAEEQAAEEQRVSASEENADGAAS